MILEHKINAAWWNYTKYLSSFFAKDKEPDPERILDANTLEEYNCELAHGRTLSVESSVGVVKVFVLNDEGTHWMQVYGKVE